MHHLNEVILAFAAAKQEWEAAKARYAKGYEEDYREARRAFLEASREYASAFEGV